MNAAVHQLALPKFAVRGMSVLDIGCADGSTLMHEFYAGASERHGIDVDSQAIFEGQHKYPELVLKVASAEAIPYPDGYFSSVISKVSLLFTDLRVSLAEIHRVLEPGGEAFLTTHDYRHHLHHLGNAIKQGAPKRVLDHAYIFGASMAYAVSGRVPARPVIGGRETFQTRGSLRRGLERAGFDEIWFERTARDFIVHATKI